MASLLISALVFLILAGAAIALCVSANSGRRAIRSRLARMGEQARIEMAESGAAGEATPARSMLKKMAERMPRPPADERRDDRRANLLMQAGFKAGDIAIVRLIKIVGTVCGLLLLFSASAILGLSQRDAILLAIVGAVIGGAAPGYYLGKRVKNRRIDIARQLSDVLDLLVVCVEAGLGLLESIKVVGGEMNEQGLAIGAELAQVSAEVNSGASLGESLRALAERSGVADIKPLAATLIQSEELGAAIGPALRAISDSMRIRRRLHAEESAQKTTIKILFPLVLMILPAMLLIIVGPAIVQTVRTLSF